MKLTALVSGVLVLLVAIAAEANQVSSGPTFDLYDGIRKSTTASSESEAKAVREAAADSRSNESVSKARRVLMSRKKPAADKGEAKPMGSPQEAIPGEPQQGDGDQKSSGGQGRRIESDPTLSEY